MVEKQQVRKEIRARRRAMSEESYEKASAIILKKMTDHPAFLQADQIFTYVSFGKEVDTKHLIRTALEKKKRVLVPKVTGQTMIFVEISDLSDLIPGTMGILEPTADVETLPDETSCMIMPGLAFDQNRNRIGYGGGYYDKYLEQYPDMQTIALAFEYQILDRIPTEATDIKPNILITERRILS